MTAAEPSARYSDVEYVFEPHSNSMPDIREYVASLWARRQFMVELANADLRTARQNTTLGSFWSILDPLFQAGIYFFLYSVMRGGGSRSAFLPVMIGCIFLFGLTTAALGEAGGSIRRSNRLVLNSTFPRALLPLTSVYKNLRKFVPSMAVFLIVFPLTGGRFGIGFFVLPLLFAIQTVMNIGIALLVSTFTTLVPDAHNLMNYVNRILFFVTPVIYPVALLSPGIKLAVGWQPLYALYASYQAIFTGGVPSFGSVVQAGAWAAVLFVVGASMFLRHEREFSIRL